MEPADFEYTRGLGKMNKVKNIAIDFEFRDYEKSNDSILGNNGAKACPRCGKGMQKSGQKADSNGIIKQRFLCPSCKKSGWSPYNFFFHTDLSK